MNKKEVTKIEPFQYDDNRTLIEITRSIFHRLYKKMFDVKEQLWDENQEVVIDIASVYTNLSEWKKFVDEYGEAGYTVADLDNWFGIDIIEEHWVKGEPNSRKEQWFPLSEIKDIRILPNLDSRIKQHQEYQHEKVNNE